MEITLGLLFLALAALLLLHFLIIDMMAITMSVVILRQFSTSLEWSVDNRHLTGLLLGVFFGSLAFGNSVLGLFLGSHQLGDLLLKTYLSLPIVGDFVLELFDLLV